MAARYGLPASALVERLESGRFRVKADVDLSTAKRYALELENMGAVCSIAEAEPAMATAPTVMGAGTPPPEASTGTVAMGSTSPPPPVGRPLSSDGSSLAEGSSSIHPLQNAGQSVASGAELSGALSVANRESQQDLGALTSGSLSLASLDGCDTTAQDAPSPDAFAPSPMPEEPHGDLFAPPEQAPAEVSLVPAIEAPEVSQAETEFRASLHESAQFSTMHGGDQAHPMLGVPASARDDSVLSRCVAAVASDSRVRLVVGVLVALVIGFLPAHVISSLREAAAFEEIDREVRGLYADVTTPEEYATLDDLLAEHREIKAAKKFNIALIGVLLWALVAAGVAFVWFGRLDWSRWDRTAGRVPSG